MREVAPGDLVISFEGTHIRAMGVARLYPYECPKPPEFGSARGIVCRNYGIWTELFGTAHYATLAANIRLHLRSVVQGTEFLKCTRIGRSLCEQLTPTARRFDGTKRTGNQ
jgi:hypothetical protein